MSRAPETGRGRARLEVEVAGETRQITVEPTDDGRLAVSWDNRTRVIDVSRLASGGLALVVDDELASHEVSGHETAPGEWLLGLNGRLVQARVADRRRRRSAGATQVEGEVSVGAPMPGRVVRVLVESGDTVDAGQGLAVVEAMKMENEVAAPAAGVVSDVRVADGDSVDAGAVLVVVKVDAGGDG